MASKTQTRPEPFPPAEAWPPDDTEESILGTDLHQTTITNLRLGINEVARLRQVPAQSVPWKALSQIALLGCVHADGSAYRTYPDVFVYPRLIAPDRGSLTLEVDGPPVLIIEVLSESTYEADVDLVRGKGYSYARAGVPEYMALDHSGHFLPEGIRAWRLVKGVYRPWEPDEHGRWQSGQIDVAIGLEGMLATVYTCDGRRILREGEIEEERARLREELARKDAELERLRRLLDDRSTQ
jgi:Putative restriction endonuclease